MPSLRPFGPGILWAATAVGASHILMAPEAGARFEYQLVWLVLAVHLLKYPAFECAPRWVAATGQSLLEAYARAPGPKHWALWLGLCDLTIQAVGVLAALLGLTAAFLVAAVGLLSLSAWALMLACGLMAALAWGRYGAMRGVNLVLMVLLSAGTLLAFLAALPPATALPQMLTPALPSGSIVLVAAILGFMPTSIAVSIWQSLWALEQGRFRPEADQVPRLTRLKEGIADLRAGYAISALLGVAFVCLGAVLLHPRGLVPQGPEVALTLSNLYTLVLGEWMRPVFLATAFFALFTTCYTSLDGFPRTFVAAVRVLRGQSAAGGGEGRLYWAFLLAATFGSMALLAVVPDPPTVVKAVGAFGLVLSPCYFALNLWAVTRGIEDPAFRPSRPMIALSLAGIALLVFAAGLLITTLLG